MTEERWTRTLTVGDKQFTAECVRRPFREGLEVRIRLPNDESISVAELGLGEVALLEKATALLLEWIKRKDTEIKK